MNELRLQYQRDTGIKIDDRIQNTHSEILDYILYLEKVIEDATKQARELSNHPIFFNKGKFITK